MALLALFGAFRPLFDILLGFRYGQLQNHPPPYRLVEAATSRSMTRRAKLPALGMRLQFGSFQQHGGPGPQMEHRGLQGPHVYVVVWGLQYTAIVTLWLFPYLQHHLVCGLTMNSAQGFKIGTYKSDGFGSQW